MATIMNYTWYWIIAVVLTSCTVTNNLYVNDAVPVGKNNTDFYFGVGTGLTPVIDSTFENGDILYSDELSIAPNLCIGGQYGISEQADLRFSVHLPYLIAGVGLHAGIQYSFFKEWTKFNLAVGTDVGGVFAKDSITFWDGFSVGFDPAAKGAINADFFLPVSYSFNENYRIILTSRISFNTIYVRKNEFGGRSQKYSPIYPSLSLGARLNILYLEATVQFIEDTVMPGFGIAYFM